MNPFNRRAAIRIAAVSVLLAAVASPLAWMVAHEAAETNTVSMAVEESQRLARHFDRVLDLARINRVAALTEPRP